MDASDDPWGDLNARYRHDADAQFLVFVEQFAEARRLLDSKSVPQLRMALVAVDNLAEVLLARRLRFLYRCAEDPLLAPVERFDQRERMKLNSDFGSRVMVGCWAPPEGSPLSSHVVPLLDGLDAEIFRVGHAYRRRVYHADDHNEAVLELVVRGYMLAVGRAFVRAQPSRTGRSMRPRLASLSAFGYEPSNEGLFAGVFVPVDAAEAVTAHLTSDLTVDLAEARTQLAGDLVRRADWADAMIADLASDGYDRERLEAGVPWMEFWEKHGADEVLVQLSRDYDEARWLAFRDPEADENAYRLRMAEADAALMKRNERFQELHAAFEPALSVNSIDSVRRLARRLTTARTLAALLERYRKLDDAIEALERILDEIAIGWDRHIQEEGDRLRDEGW